MLLVSYIRQYVNTSITVLTNQVWKLLIALFKVPNTGAFMVLQVVVLESFHLPDSGNHFSWVFQNTHPNLTYTIRAPLFGTSNAINNFQTSFNRIVINYRFSRTISSPLHSISSIFNSISSGEAYSLQILSSILSNCHSHSFFVNQIFKNSAFKIVNCHWNSSVSLGELGM